MDLSKIVDAKRWLSKGIMSDVTEPCNTTVVQQSGYAISSEVTMEYCKENTCSSNEAGMSLQIYVTVKCNDRDFTTEKHGSKKRKFFESETYGNQSVDDIEYYPMHSDSINIIPDKRTENSSFVIIQENEFGNSDHLGTIAECNFSQDNSSTFESPQSFLSFLDELISWIGELFQAQNIKSSILDSVSEYHAIGSRRI